jgi:hypothetical protein
VSIVDIGILEVNNRLKIRHIHVAQSGARERNNNDERDTQLHTKKPKIQDLIEEEKGLNLT